MTDTILCVDDDANLLEGLKRQLRKQFTLETALSGEAGLVVVKEDGPFAVVVSDMRMPGMNGARFLAQVRAMAPDTVRILLTGQTDIQDAIVAVNEGHIFRFLTKPCPPRYSPLPCRRRCNSTTFLPPNALSWNKRSAAVSKC